MLSDYTDRLTDTAQKRGNPSLANDGHAPCCFLRHMTVKRVAKADMMTSGTVMAMARIGPAHGECTANKHIQHLISANTDAKHSQSIQISLFFYLGSHGTVSVFWSCCCHREAAGTRKLICSINVQ